MAMAAGRGSLLMHGGAISSARNSPDWLYVDAAAGAASWIDKRSGRSWSQALLRRAGALPLRRMQQALALGQAGASSLAQARQHCRTLGIDWSGQCARGLAPIAEPERLASAGPDHYGRRLWLQPDALRAWLALQRAAAADGVALVALSGFRPVHYQAMLLRRKLARGQALAQILRVNAAPGFSEHHGGRALDLADPRDPVLETRFEASAAFAWLQVNGSRFGFVMSYPDHHPAGYVYEPWHWCHRGSALPLAPPRNGRTGYRTPRKA